LRPPKGCRGHFPVLCGWFVLLSDRLGAAVVAVVDVVGMEGLSATVLSVAGAAPELSDRKTLARNDGL